MSNRAICLLLITACGCEFGASHYVTLDAEYSKVIAYKIDRGGLWREICPDCNGRGITFDSVAAPASKSPQFIQTGNHPDGSPKGYVTDRLIDGGNVTWRTKCPKCNATGVLKTLSAAESEEHVAYICSLLQQKERFRTWCKKYFSSRDSNSTTESKKGEEFASAILSIAERYANPPNVAEEKNEQAQFAEVNRIPVSVTNSVGISMILIPEGTILARDYNDYYEVRVPTYRISSTEITQFHWRKVMGTAPWGSDQSNDSRPATGMSNQEIQDFVGKLTKLEGGTVYCLPSQCQWMRARYRNDKERELLECGLCSGIGVGRTAWVPENTRYDGKPFAQHVGTKPPNSWGLFDMIGNATEVVAVPYPAKSKTGETTDFTIREISQKKIAWFGVCDELSWRSDKIVSSETKEQRNATTDRGLQCTDATPFAFPSSSNGKACPAITKSWMPSRLDAPDRGFRVVREP